MAYSRVQKSGWHSPIQKNQSRIVPPPIDIQTQADSLPSSGVVSGIPSKAQRDAIRRSLFEKWAGTGQIQAKLTIGEPGDKYEQEADRVAAQVVNQINAPAPQQSTQSQSVQREAIPEEEDELQMKSEVGTIQREVLPDEEELQMKPMVQLQPGGGGMAATPELETTIQQARGSGQSLADTIREPMEQAFGADFSGVKVHTGAQSDQLNRSIQARAFTTGQDIFFRQGAYDPGSRGGQELIAHELTHVVQQNGSTVQPTVGNHAMRQLIGRVQRVPMNIVNAVVQCANEMSARPTETDLQYALQHIKRHDTSVPRNRGIGGCHDRNEFMRLENGTDEKYCFSVQNIANSRVPGVSIITYKLYKLNRAQQREKDESGNFILQDKNLTKTVYDPATWSDAPLLAAATEAAQHAYDNNALSREWEGTTSAGYRIRGYVTGGQIKSFFFST